MLHNHRSGWRGEQGERASECASFVLRRVSARVHVRVRVMLADLFHRVAKAEIGAVGVGARGENVEAAWVLRAVWLVSNFLLFLAAADFVPFVSWVCVCLCVVVGEIGWCVVEWNNDRTQV